MSAESVINNPPKEFTEPCEACGVSEFQLGVKHAEQRIIKLLEPLGECEPSICGKGCRGQYKCVGWAYRHAIRLIKGENK